jgi:pleckstrin family protein A (phosphoinositide binding specific) protein 8
MDLVIPGEQHIYLRAATSQERQQWLVALGSAKACVTTRNRKDSGGIAPPTLNSKCWKHSEYSDI